MEQTDEENSNSRKFWIISDNRKLDSLKSEFKADYNKQCDCTVGFHMYLYKDNYIVKDTFHYDWLAMYSGKRYFSLGKIKQSMIPVSTIDNICPNLSSVRLLVDSLKKNNINYTIIPPDSSDKNVSEFSVRLSLFVRYESKLISGSTSNSLNNTEAVVQELERLYPEITKGNITVESTGGNVWFSAYLFSDKYFKFDISRLKQTDLFREYDIVPSYTVTTYSKI